MNQISGEDRCLEGRKCSHKLRTAKLGWTMCVDCGKPLWADSTMRQKTFLDKDTVGTPPAV
jgi:hypothetical protein